MTDRTRHADAAWPAPAKINLFLHITGRRADGYHDLQTLFQILDWGDELRFTVDDSGAISRHCNSRDIPAQEDLCVRAAKKLQAHAGVDQGVHIDLLKRVPMGAGLGGGSSDAATTLVALNRLWSCGLELRQLADIGFELGADVPVFVHGHSALAGGRGEQLEPVELGRRFYLLVFPDVAISTAKVFNDARLKRNSARLDRSELRLRAGRNDCLDVVLLLYPGLKKLVRDLGAWGEPRMSGTGSTFFLQFESKNAAIEAARNLKCRYNVRAVGGVDVSPLLDRVSASG
jgi:4-diphosphocytidyl-2-C-methyl-D-erythritol kinase